MASERLAQSTVEEWLSELGFGNVREVNNPEVEFFYAVEHRPAGLTANVLREPGNSFVGIVVQLPIDPGVWATLLDLSYERRQLKINIGDTLTNAPGTWDYIDDRDQPTSFEDARYIRLTARIYADGTSQQHFSDSITDLFSAIIFIRESINATHNAIEDRS